MRLLPPRPLAPTALLLAALSPVAAAQTLGEAPPELDAVKWYNSPPLTFEELRGKAVLVDVFRTWCGPCNAALPELNKKMEKEEGKGLVLIGITDEDEDLVDRWFAERQPRFPIAILKTSAVEEALGVKFFPTVAVVDPGGKLTYAGSRGGEGKYLKAALDGAQKGPLHPKELGPAVKALRAGELAESYGKVLPLAQKVESGPLAESVARFRAHLEGSALEAVEKARALADEGLVARAHARLEPIAQAKPPFPASADAAELLESLEAQPEFKNELKGGELYEEAQALARQGRFAAAVEAYVKVYKKLDGTKIAGVARASAEQLVADGKPGYRGGSCPACKSAGRACADHTESIDL